MKGLRQRGGLVSHLQRKRPSEKPSKQMASDSQQEPREQDDAGGDVRGPALSSPWTISADLHAMAPIGWCCYISRFIRAIHVSVGPPGAVAGWPV